VGNDEMVKMFPYTLYILMFVLLSLDRGRANEVSDYPLQC